MQRAILRIQWKACWHLVIAVSLAAFVAVAELSSFSGAAVRLQVSPSAVSQSIRALEQRLGVALLNRTTRSVSLTEAGARYLERIATPLRELIKKVTVTRRNLEKFAGIHRHRFGERHGTIGLVQKHQ